jgi:hypothetical protein
MKTRLMNPERDFELEAKVPPETDSFIQDLELGTLFGTMAAGDKFLFRVAKQALLSGLGENEATILYRQAVLEDCLENEEIIRALYGIAIEGVENKRKGWFGIISSYPRGILDGAVGLLQLSVATLRKLRLLADEHAPAFQSDGFQSFFKLIQTELGDGYLTQIETHLKNLKFRHGVLLSARLGKGNAGTNYLLRKPGHDNAGWFGRLFRRGPAGYSFRLADRDEAGARALSDLQDRGLNVVANVAAQSSDHLLAFYDTLRTELAFYVGCLNLHRALRQREVAVCFPAPAPASTRKHAAIRLRDVCLALTMPGPVIANDLAGDGKTLTIITGANQGGKSTFLRALGLAQVMMQSGMFVTAEWFQANLCSRLFTHYKREEDPSMKSGKFDEELSRMSGIVDALRPDSLVLFNESFAATNDREGSEIARQIVVALLEAGVKVAFVTHLYEFAHALWEEEREDALFLRAERGPDGRRTFRLIPGEPLQTSFGVDLYQRIFELGEKAWAGNRAAGKYEAEIHRAGTSER